MKAKLLFISWIKNEYLPIYARGTKCDDAVTNERRVILKERNEAICQESKN